MSEVPFIVEQKKLEDYEVLKEKDTSPEIKLLVEIYERRIAELNAVIEKLISPQHTYTNILPGTNPAPINVKPKIATTSQLVAEMEKRVRIEGVKK